MFTNLMLQSNRRLIYRTDTYNGVLIGKASAILYKYMQPIGT